MSPPLVSVLVPAFNASATLDATLRSARGQTHAELEIIVVDDGSTDATVEIATRHAAADPRVRILCQPNGGVARARNHGLAVAEGAFIAPLDSDDVWHPEKIARQLAAIEAAGSGCALAYNWFRRIDPQDRLLGASARPTIAGYALYRHIDWNFISNGSTPLVRTAAAREVGGYDPALRDAGVQGCEDYLFQLRLARRHEFACVPAFLTGYRVMPGAMSSGAARMIQSHLMAYSLLRGEVDRAAARLIDRKIAAMRMALLRNRLRRGAVFDGAAQLIRAFARHPAGAIDGLQTEWRRLAASRLTDPGSAPGAAFDTLAPEQVDGAWRTARSDAWLRRLTLLDEAAALSR